MGGTRAERERRQEEEEEGRKESVELTRTPGFMGGTRAESWADRWGIISGGQGGAGGVQEFSICRIGS